MTPPRFLAVDAVPADTSLLGVPVFSDLSTPPGTGAEVHREFLAQRCFEGQPGQAQALLADDGGTVIALGVGDRDSVTADVLRQAGAALARQSGNATAIATTLAGLRDRVGRARILAVLEPRSNTMRAGIMKDRLATSLEQADRVFCYSANLGWDAGAALAPLGARLRVESDLKQLAAAVLQEAQAGDQVLVMSNGGFGGIHETLLKALAARKIPAART